MTEVPAVPTPPASGTPLTAPTGATAFVPDAGDHRKGLSIMSLVLGILGLLLSLVAVGGVLSLIAVVLGHISAVKQPWARPLWLTGLITGYLGIVVSIIVVIAAVVLGSMASWFLQIL
ncbi:MAG: hypothetical protein ABJB03_02245 [Rhodoglobus sp.]